jgi:hypothetical protein
MSISSPGDLASQERENTTQAECGYYTGKCQYEHLFSRRSGLTGEIEHVLAECRYYTSKACLNISSPGGLASQEREHGPGGEFRQQPQSGPDGCGAALNPLKDVFSVRIRPVGPETTYCLKSSW